MSVVPKDAILLPRRHVKYRPMSSGGMLADLVTGACFELNHVGADVWTLLVDGTNVGAAIEAIRRKYGVESNTIETDTLRLCRELLDAGLVEPKTNDGTPRP